MTDKDREELISAIDNLSQLDLTQLPRAEVAKLKIERVLLRNPVTAFPDTAQDTGYSSVSVLGGWQTFDRLRQKRIGPVFNDAPALWEWQGANLPRE